MPYVSYVCQSRFFKEFLSFDSKMLSLFGKEKFLIVICVRPIAYQRQLITLGTGDKATGVFCYHCRDLIKIGSKFVKKIGKSGGPYHPLCAERLHII